MLAGAIVKSSVTGVRVVAAEPVALPVAERVMVLGLAAPPGTTTCTCTVLVPFAGMLTLPPPTTEQVQPALEVGVRVRLRVEAAARFWTVKGSVTVVPGTVFCGPGAIICSAPPGVQISKDLMVHVSPGAMVARFHCR